jgi:glycosyltransferase involved in cell wall biosynthesis
MRFLEFIKDRTILENAYRNLMPKISIVMPTYCRNQEGLLDRCIQSVLAQSFKNFEFIIIDDGSIDGTEGVVRGYAQRDARIVYARHSENSGLPAVRTDEGILLARAPYIAFMFDDNVWVPDVLESLLQEIEANSVDVVHGNTEMVMVNGKSILLGAWPLTLELLEHLNTIPNAALMCRRDFFEKYGLYDPHLILRRICDWDLWLRALHMGAKYRHLDKVIGREFGTASDFSIGRTVHLDYKIAYPYMICPEKIKERSRALRPENINQVDVFDPEKVLPYVRDLSEWEKFEESVYRPFFIGHPQYSYEKPAPHNRRYDSELGGYKLNAVPRIFQQKRRILLVANRFSRLVREWRYALSRVLEANVLSCTEWNVALFHPSEIDLVILLDCSASYLQPIIRQFRDHAVPLIYLVVHGEDNHNLSEPDLLQRFNFISNPHILQALGAEHYFSLPGTPWPEHHRMGAEELMLLSDQVFSIEGVKGDLKPPGNPPVIEFIPNQIPETEGAGKAPSPKMYWGDAEKLSEKAIRAIERILKKTSQGMQWEIYIHPDTCLPSVFRPFREKIHLTPTHETLPTLVTDLRHAFLGVPEAILCRYSNFHKNLMEEDLVANQSALVSLEILDEDDSAKFCPEYYQNKIREFRSRSLERREIYRQDSRHLHLANFVLSSILRKKASRIQSGSRGPSRKALVLLNSQLLAGSEMVGVLIGKSLARLGWDVQMSVPECHDYPDKDEKDINGWLQERGLAPVVKAPYGISQMSFFRPKKEVAEKTRIFQEWLEAQGADVLICTGFIAEVFLLPQDHRLVYLGLMQPWGFHQDLMTFLRDRVHGMFSDSRWAAREWNQWVPPPMEWIPTIVEAEHFGDWNKALPPAPVRIAVGGTIQPRKRQLEAI